MIRWPSPPDRLPPPTAAVFAEMLERLNPQRRMRTCPRVSKRARHNTYRVKRPGDTGVTHPSPQGSGVFRECPYLS
jgi:hypothetical protein